MSERLPFLRSLTDYGALSNEAGGPIYDLDDPAAVWNVERPIWHLGVQESGAMRINDAIFGSLATDTAYQNRSDAVYGVAASDSSVLGGAFGAGQHFLADQHGGHWRPDFKKAGMEFLIGVGSGASALAAGGEVAGAMLVEATLHEAWHVATPLLSGDTKPQMIGNALLSSLGAAPRFGERRAENVYEGASDLDRQIAAYDYGEHRGDKSTVSGMRAYNELVAARDAQRRV
jgi:hypothetical protein